MEVNKSLKLSIFLWVFFVFNPHSESIETSSALATLYKFNNEIALSPVNHLEIVAFPIPVFSPNRD